MKEKYARTAPSNGALWEEFNEQHHHQIIEKRTIINAKLAKLFWQILAFNVSMKDFKKLLSIHETVQTALL